jgi:hypothetical protein
MCFSLQGRSFLTNGKGEERGELGEKDHSNKIKIQQFVYESEYAKVYS